MTQISKSNLSIKSATLTAYIFIVMTTHYILAQNSPTPSATTSIVRTTSVVSCPQNATLQNGQCQCISGYTLNNGVCEDNNECSSNTSCHTEATCTNTPGGFTCTCNPGYRGDGQQCIKYSPCQTLNICDVNADCTDNGDQANCTCKSGFTGNGTICNDVNECAVSSSCHVNATCTNTQGSFLCQCNSGFSGDGKSCSDINECLIASSCQANSTCANTIGSFTCTCNAGFENIDGICREDRFVSTAQSESNSDQNFTQENKEIPIPLSGAIAVGNTLHNIVYLSTHGTMSFGTRVLQSTAGRLGNPIPTGVDLVAPYWANVDIEPVTGFTGNRVFLSTHQKNDGKSNTGVVLQRIDEYIKSYTDKAGSNTFATDFAIVVTWDKVLPTLAGQNTQQPASFQLVVASNGTRTFACYIYQDGQMKWTRNTDDVAIGHVINNIQASLNPSIGGNIYNFDDVVFSSTGRKGIHVVEVGLVSSNPPSSCYAASRQQPATSIASANQAQATPCPPSYGQAQSDTRLVQDTSNIYTTSPSFVCYYRHQSVTLNGFFSTNLCCYQTGNSNNPLLTINFVSNPQTPLSIFMLYTSTFTSALSSYKTFYDDCCRHPLSKCSHFTDIVLPGIANGYTAPATANVRGDPHITTLDGKDYSYNGLGDYVLLRVLSDANGFTVHSRTAKAAVNASAQTQASATVFSGFALRETGTPVFEFLMNTTTEALTFLIDGTVRNLGQFTTAQTINDTVITYQKGQKLTLVFPSGVAVEITIQRQLLSITVALGDNLKGDKTRGLLGVFNDNPNDDFKLPNGTVLNPNSTEEEIFYNFGNLWMLNQADSLFTVKFSPENFIPVFFNSIDALFGNRTDLKNEAIQLCGGSSMNEKDCLFDFFVTRNRIVAQQTSTARQTFVSEKALLNTIVPVITGPRVVTATFGRTSKFRITATSNSSSARLFYSVTTNGTAVMVDSSTGTVTWSVNEFEDISFEFRVTDLSNNFSATLSPQIKLCYCNNGTCDFTQDNQFSLNTPALSRFACNCPANYAGAFCQTFVDPCQAQPCFRNTTCTVLQSGNRTCGTCPGGRIGNGVECYFLDECERSKPCDQICTSTSGQFNCSCRSGFNLVNKTRCQDINECLQVPSVCHSNATCQNSAGSHNCTCNTGFTGNGVNCTDIDECQQGLCQQNCTNTQGSFTCSCRSGYTLDTTNKRQCININECTAGTHNCNSNANCFDIQGSFFCLCKAGFSGDGRTCISLATTSSIALTSIPSVPSTTAALPTTTSVVSMPATTTVPVVPTTRVQVTTSTLITAVPTSVSLFTSITPSRIVVSPTTVIVPVTSSVVIGTCNTNPCLNGGTCALRNGSPVCTCKGVYFGSTCTEHRPLVEITLQLTSLSLDGSPIDFNSQNGQDLVVAGSSLNQRAVAALNTELTGVSKSAESKAQEARVISLTKPMLTVRFTVAFAPDYTETPNAFQTKLGNTLKNSNYTVTSPATVFTLNATALKATDHNECSSAVCHSQATCTNTELSFACKCNSGYEGSGKTCTAISSSRSTIIISITVTLACLLILIAIIIVYLRYRRRRKTTYRTRSTEEGGEYLDSGHIWAFINNRLRANVRRQRDEQLES